MNFKIHHKNIKGGKEKKMAPLIVLVKRKMAVSIQQKMNEKLNFPLNNLFVRYFLKRKYCRWTEISDGKMRDGRDLFSFISAYLTYYNFWSNFLSIEPETSTKHPPLHANAVL